MDRVCVAAAFIAGLLMLAACGSNDEVGSVHTVATNTGATLDWACFPSKDDLVMDALAQGSSQRNIEDTSALWLEPGDTVKIIQQDSDTALAVRVRILLGDNYPDRSAKIVVAGQHSHLGSARPRREGVLALG